MYFVQIFAALFAKIFVGGAFDAENSDAGAVLPDFADVALHKETRHIVCELNRRKDFSVRPVDRRRTWVIFRATDAADGLVLLVLRVITGVGHVCIFVS